MDVEKQYKNYLENYFTIEIPLKSLESLRGDKLFIELWKETTRKAGTNIPVRFVLHAFEKVIIIWDKYRCYCANPPILSSDVVYDALHTYFYSSPVFTAGVMEVIKYGWDTSKVKSIDWDDICLHIDQNQQIKEMWDEVLDEF